MVMHSVAHYLADRNKTLRRLRGAVVEKVGTLKIEYWWLVWYNINIMWEGHKNIMNIYKKDDIAGYIQPVLGKMCLELLTNGITFESQFDKFGSGIWKYNIEDMSRILSEKTGLNLFYTQNPEQRIYMFAIYDTDRCEREEVLEKLTEYSDNNFEKQI